ncbi:MAG: ATP-dependent Clp protease proteolytic subunit, partial [uncultured Thermoleophilia bacterium]
EPPGTHGRRAERSRRAFVRHLLAPAERAHRLPRHARLPRDRQPDRGAADPPRVRRPGQGRRALHQLARRRRLRGHGDLRHDAVHQARGADDLLRHGDVDGRDPAGGRDGRQAHGAPERQDHDPPGLVRVPGAGHGHRDPRARGARRATADGRGARRPHRQDGRADPQGHGARLLPVGGRGEGLRPHRHGRLRAL